MCESCKRLVLALLLTLTRSTISTTSSYQRYPTNMRCGDSLVTALVPSVAVCAVICYKEPKCAAFSVDAPDVDVGVGSGGAGVNVGVRLCEVTDNPDTCRPASNYHTYLPTSATPSTTPPTESTATEPTTSAIPPTTVAATTTPTTVAATTTPTTVAATTTPTTAAATTTPTTALITTTTISITTTDPTQPPYACDAQGLPTNMVASGIKTSNNKKNLVGLFGVDHPWVSPTGSTMTVVRQQCGTFRFITQVNCNPTHYTCTMLKNVPAYQNCADVTVSKGDKLAKCPSGQAMTTVSKSPTNQQFETITCCDLL